MSDGKALAHSGLVKLMEECGELIQIAAKKVQYSDSLLHPDGKGLMHLRIEEEVADVLAAARYVISRYPLDEAHIEARAKTKLATFEGWDVKHYEQA